MLNAGRAIDILRMAGSCRNSTIKRLSELTDDHKIIHGAIAKGTEHVHPILRERLLSIAKWIDKIFPAIAGRQFGCRAAKLHGFDQGRS
jgi:hypothetical protein